MNSVETKWLNLLLLALIRRSLLLTCSLEERGHDSRAVLRLRSLDESFTFLSADLCSWSQPCRGHEPAPRVVRVKSNY